MPVPMNYRSTDALGSYVHFGGETVLGSEYGRAVHTVPNASTTATDYAVVTVAADDANAGLQIKAKGTGTLMIGDSSNTVNFSGSTGNSFKGAYSVSTNSSIAAITPGHAAEITLSTGVSTNLPSSGDVYSLTYNIATANMSSIVGVAGVRFSTAVASRVTIVLNAFGSTATSTLSGTFRLSWLDIT